MTADYTIDHRFQATPGQVAAIERDGFLAVAGPTCPDCSTHGPGGVLCPTHWRQRDRRRVRHPLGTVPTTKPCPECGGSRVIHIHPRLGFAVRCPACNGDGTVPITVVVVVPERECPDCEGTCPECGRWNNGDHDPEFDPVCWYCESKPCRTCGDTIPARTLLRGTAEAVPVVDTSDDECPSVIDFGSWLSYCWPGEDRWKHHTPISHHFADVPRPEVGDTAWIIRGE